MNLSKRPLLLITSFATFAAIGFTFVSCNTPSSKSESKTGAGIAGSGHARGIAYDSNLSFDQKGYQELTVGRDFESGSISKDQLKKELAGREIWYNSAPNGRFHSYVLTQKVESPINWNRVLGARNQWRRFNMWGLINDPDCCAPGDDCAQKKIEVPSGLETYGFNYCKGDEDLAQYIGNPKKDYTNADPACNSRVVRAADGTEKLARENSCHLAYGTSTGVVGFRKFPNPRFNAKRWASLGQGDAAWDKWETEREFDPSYEPPYLVGISCASCHASFDPTHPPKDVNRPKWDNISGVVGNQYIQFSELFVSGAKHDSMQRQLFVALSRPGTTDTSAVPNDFYSNPGTINAIINIPQRPTFKDFVARWNRVGSCTEGSDCQVVTNTNGDKEYWQYKREMRDVFHILKGGEDSVGPDLAVQRVYVNIGMCAEKCWMNHHTDFRALGKNERGFGQTPFDIKQCREECAPFRANEDRSMDIVQFLLSARPYDLKTALVNQSKIKVATTDPTELDGKFAEWIENRYGKGSIEKGRQLFAESCAKCHSSQNTNKHDLEEVTDDFTTIAENDGFHQKVTLSTNEVIRADWMGNDKSTDANFIKTYECRAKHSNHMRGHLWDQFASETYKNDKHGKLRDTRGRIIDGGPGFYRNISLLNSWAYAPFMHNNAVGPEICGRPKVAPGSNEIDFDAEVHDNTLVDQSEFSRLPRPEKQCKYEFDPSIEGRLALFDESMDELFANNRKYKKLSLSTEDIRLPLGMTLTSIGKTPQKFYLIIPKGTKMSMIGSFDIKTLAKDIFGSLMLSTAANQGVDSVKLAYWKGLLGNEGGERMANAVDKFINLFRDAAKSTKGMQVAFDGIQRRMKDGSSEIMPVFLKYYADCNVDREDGGHGANEVFRRNASKEDINALKAFLATL